MNRVIVIGDVHGCAVELTELIHRLGLQASDRLVFLGDLMDRGPLGPACVNIVRALGAECTASNHDEKHVRWRRHERTRGPKKNPIRFTDERAAQNRMLTDDDIAWVAGLPMSIGLGGGWHAVHAGLETCKTFEEQKDSQALLRTRYINEDGTAYSAKDPVAADPTDKWFWSQRWRGPEKIVYGHHIHRFIAPRIDSHELGAIGSGVVTECVGIDTGCYAGGRLTAMIVRPDGTYYFEHVDAARVYEPLSDKYGANKPEPLRRAAENSNG